MEYLEEPTIEDTQIERLRQELYKVRRSRATEYNEGDESSAKTKRIVMHEQLGAMWTLLLESRHRGGNVADNPINGADACLLMVGMKLLRRMGNQSHDDSLLDLINYALISEECAK